MHQIKFETENQENKVADNWESSKPHFWSKLAIFKASWQMYPIYPPLYLFFTYRSRTGGSWSIGAPLNVFMNKLDGQKCKFWIVATACIGAATVDKRYNICTKKRKLTLWYTFRYIIWHWDGHKVSSRTRELFFQQRYLANLMRTGQKVYFGFHTFSNTTTIHLQVGTK